MLAEIYNWFTEGFDTKDLQEAKALLRKLSKVGGQLPCRTLTEGFRFDGLHTSYAAASSGVSAGP